MSSYRDLVKKVNEEKNSSAPVSTQGQNTGESASGSSFRDLVRQVNNGTIRIGSRLNDSEVDAWFDGTVSVMDRANVYMSANGYKKQDTLLEQDFDTYLSQANDVAQYLRAHRYEFENYDDLIQAYHDTVSNLRSYKSGVSNTAKFYSQWANEDEYNIAVQQNEWLSEYGGKTKLELDGILADMDDGDEKSWLTAYAQSVDYDEKSKYDIAAGEKEIRHLESILETYQNLSRGAQNYRTVASLKFIQSQYGDEADIQALITQKKQYLNQAKRLQEGIKFSGVADPKSEYYDPEFEKYSKYVSTEMDTPLGGLVSQYGMGYDDLTYEYINNPNGIRDVIDQKTRVYGSSKYKENVYEEKGYSYMTQAEVAIYNYYYAKDGKEKAEQYLDSIQETLNYRKANAMFANLEDNTALEIAFGFAAGTDQFEQGVKNLFNTDDDYIPASAIQMAAGMVREDLADDSIPVWYNFADKKWEDKVFGQSVGQMGYDAVSTSANMLPSIMASMAVGMINPVAGAVGMINPVAGKAVGIAGKAVGSALMGASAAGNAYQEMLNLGYDKGQARTYSTLVGASEAGLQYLLGGVGELGGTLSGNVIAKAMNGVDNAFLRFAIEFAGNMASEGLEEGLQEILTPWLQNLVMHTDEDVNWSEVAYSTLLGALTAGVMEGPSTISAGVSTTRTGAQLRNAGISAERLADLGKTFAADTAAAQIAGRVNENTGAYTMGRLFNEIGATLTEQNMNDITNALIKEGIDRDIAEKNAEALAAVVEGANLTDRQVKIIEANETLAKAVRTTIIDPNATWFQRTKGYNEALMALAQEKSSKAKQASPEQGNAPGSDNVDAQNKNGAEGGYGVSENGKTTYIPENKEVSIKKIASIKDGAMTLELDDGSIVPAEDVQFGNSDDALVYSTIADMGVSADTANALVEAFVPSKDISAQMYALDIREAYDFGRYNYPMKAKEGDIYASVKKQAWNEGRIAAIKSSDQKQSNVDATFQKAQKVLKQEGKEATGNYHAALEDGITALSLNESQKASYHLADQVAQAAKSNVIVYVGKTAEFGYYNPKTDTIHLNLNAANKSRTSMMAFTLGHELVHRAKKGSPAKYQAFADFLIQEYGKKGVSLEAMVEEQIQAAKDNDIEITRDEAFEEVVCDSCQKMLLDTDAGKKLAEFAAETKQNKSFLEDIKRWITEFMDKLRKIFKDVEPDSLAAKEFTKLDENVKQILADMFVEMTIDAGEHLSVIQSAFGKDTEVKVNDQGEFTMAQNADGSEKLFNLATWENGGRETLEATLLREGYTEEEVNAALTIMDGKQDLVRKIANEVDDNGKIAFPEQGRINEVTLTTDIKDGHSVLSALISNGDYPVNIDLLMVCKKRKAYQRVINRLCETGMIQQATVDALAIAEINKILGKYGFETACLGCFVESRRLRIQEWAQTIVKEWNSEVKKRNSNAKPFGFGKGEATLNADEVMQLIGELESGGAKNDQGNLNLGQGSAVKRMGVLLDKVPSLRRTLSVEDLITPDGLTALRQFDSNLFSMVKSRYGSNSPKFVQEFNPYSHELAKYGKVPAEYKSLREYLYAIGGARMQSFSDFIVENWFDYCQIVADLAARKLPMHTYTKEIALAKLFGMTGIKINMSLIPDVDRSLGKEYAGLTRNAKGELELIWADKDRYKATGGKSYMQSINFADAVALQNDPKYSANVGTIAVGISDKHIRMMLADPRIRMVIPYHSSGMNPIFADMMGTSYYKDYTNFQNTTVKQLYNSKGQPVSLKLDKTQVGKLTGGFLFNSVLQELGDARAAADAYKAWCADASQHTITIKGETYTAELTPKFDDFSGETNYYKLLEDFNAYDCITEQAAPQMDVQQVYPEGFEDILREELSGQEKHRQKQEKNQAFDKAMGEIETYLKNHTKADTVHYANQHGIKLGAKDKKLNAADKARLKQLQDEGVSFKLPKKSDPEGYDTTNIHWAIKAGIIDRSNQRAFWEQIANIRKLGYYNIKTDDGEYAIKAANAIMFTDADYKAPTLSSVIVVNTTDKKTQYYVTRWIIDEIQEYGSVEYAYELVSGVYGEELVRWYHQGDFYSDDWKDGYGEGKNGRRANSESGGRGVRHSLEDTLNKLPVGEDTSPRALLANAFESIITNPIEKKKLEEYKTQVEKFNAEEAKLQKLRAEIKELSFTKGPRDTKKIRSLQFEAQAVANNLNTYDQQLLRLEAAKPLQNILEREKKMAYDRGVQKERAAQEAYRLKAEVKQSEILRDYRETKAALRQQKSDTSTIEKEFIRIAKAYEKLDTKTTAKIGKDTKTISDLKAKLKEETQKYREDQKIWEAEFNRLLSEYEAAGRSIDRLQAKIERQQQVAEKRADDRKRSAVREKIKSFKARLESSLVTPTDRRYVPIDLIKAMVEVCELIDTDTDLYKTDGTINKAQEKRNITKEKLQNLKDEYEKLKTNSDPVYAGEFDEMVYAYLTQLRDKYTGKNLNEMSFDELAEMYEILRAIEETLLDARKLIGWGDAETVYEAGDAIVSEQAKITKSRKGGKRNAAQIARDSSLNLSLAPVRNVERMSGYNQSSALLKLFKKFEQGIRKKNKFVMEAYKSFESLTSSKEYDDAIYKEVDGKKYKDIKGRSFGLSKMQMMQAILSWERESANKNLHHIESGGFTFADLEMLRKGNLKAAISAEYSHRVPAAVNMVAEFNEILKDDKWCQDYMAAARKFFNGTAKDAINETSIALKHRIIAKDKNYIPFEVDKNFIVREISAANDIQQTINSYGMLMDTKNNAPQSLIITGLNNVLDRHIDMVGNVYGLAIEVRNFNKVWNVRSLDAEGSDPTVKEIIETNWGKSGVKHIEDTVQDIQGPRISKQSMLYKKVKSNYIGATFFLNLSVVTKQIGSLFSATSMLKWRGPIRMVGNLFYTMANYKKISAEVDKYTASVWMRRQGVSDAELHTFLTEGKKSFVGKLTGKLPAVFHPGKWIAAMDSAVALSLWKYAKIDTAKRTGLKGDALLKATAEFYDEVIENTQSMSDVLHRPEIQKRDDVISESLGMFKTDLYQMAGQLQVTAGRFTANKTKENGMAVSRTLYAIAMSAVWAQLMTTVFALLRYKVDQYRDDDDEELTVESWMKRQGFSFAGDIMGYILPIFGSEMIGFFENIMYGESDDFMDSIALTAINDLFDVMTKIGSTIKDGEMPKPTDIKKIVVKALQCFGLPANNILRTVEAIHLHATDIANGEFLSFEAGVERSPKHHVHRIMEAVDAGNITLAVNLYEEALEETALDKTKGGAIGEDDIKSAKSSLMSALGAKYKDKDGEISKGTVRRILSEIFEMDQVDIYWKLDEWDYNKMKNESDDDYNKYGEFYAAVESGENLEAVIQAYIENGVKKSTLAGQLTEHFKPQYLAMSESERSKFSPYLTEAFELCGSDTEDVEKKLWNWEFEDKYGFAWSDRKQAYLDGVVSGPELANLLVKYGDDYDAEKAKYQVEAYDWEADGIEGATAAAVERYNTWCKPAGVSREHYMQIRTFSNNTENDVDENGKSISYSAVRKIMAEIDRLPISAAKKTALAYSCGWKEKTIEKYKLW